jgi:hypothetical protein
MIYFDQIHVAMTKMCGMVTTPTCQSNIFFITKNDSTLYVMYDAISLYATGFKIMQDHYAAKYAINNLCIMSNFDFIEFIRSIRKNNRVDI